MSIDLSVPQFPPRVLRVVSGNLSKDNLRYLAESTAIGARLPKNLGKGHHPLYSAVDCILVAAASALIGQSVPASLAASYAHWWLEPYLDPDEIQNLPALCFIWWSHGEAGKLPHHRDFAEHELTGNLTAKLGEHYNGEPLVIAPWGAISRQVLSYLETIAKSDSAAG